MSGASLALRKAIRAELLADAALFALIGDRVFDRVSPNAAFPYVRFGPVQVLAEAQDCLDECVSIAEQIDVFSREPGKTQAARIAARVARVLNNSELTLDDGFRLVDLKHNSTMLMDDPDGLTTHAVVNIAALVESV